MHRFAYPSRRYRQYVEWIALNDNDGGGDDLEAISGYCTTVMLAHVNSIPSRRVAADVVAIRLQEGRLVGNDA